MNIIMNLMFFLLAITMLREQLYYLYGVKGNTWSHIFSKVTECVHLKQAYSTTDPVQYCDFAPSDHRWNACKVFLRNDTWFLRLKSMCTSESRYALMEWLLQQFGCSENDISEGGSTYNDGYYMKSKANSGNRDYLYESHLSWRSCVQNFFRTT